MKNKTFIESYQSIRRTWTMNPITRVQDNDTRKDKKKSRVEGKRISKGGYAI